MKNKIEIKTEILAKFISLNIYLDGKYLGFEAVRSESEIDGALERINQKVNSMIELKNKIDQRLGA